ncbi:hypothetical protein CKO38_07540 [Rhodospirillum rubrum]|uniref:hypothetical protein n=1 Tax=Rhodospirillum rubrum TaxID=1085 RepID=UPI001906C010|nr:hypothetical protein [Rhodospirillum rubrum]MBK1666130.1 hypothetical protein [Rhodospirillum rubrum]MBK1676526.1 hypothetical protein [Rhodospirillum rubrum]
MALDPGGPGLDDLIAYAHETLDYQALERILGFYGPAYPGAAYGDTDRWLRARWRIISLLGLDHASPRAILDLGTGGGHFPLLARWLGHSCQAINPPGNPLLDELCRWIGMRPVSHRLRENKVLPEFPWYFDLVVALDITFNRKPDGSVFTLREWRFLLDDLKLNHLVPGGRLLLGFPGPGGEAGQGLDDPALLELFAARGGHRLADENAVLFDPLR